MELDFAIVGAIAGMIAIANPTQKPLKPDSSTQTRRAVTSTQTGEFNTAEHAKYKYVRWGRAPNQTSSNAVSASVNTASSDTSAKFCICMEYIKNLTGIGDIDRYEPDEYFAKYGYSRISDPQPGAIAFTVDHIAYVEAVEADGTPIITDSNSGGTDNGYGCSNVRTATPKPEYLTNPKASFWAKN